MAKEGELNLKQIFFCIDHGYSNAWDEFTDIEKKSVNFWLLNRYMSNVAGSRRQQENAVLKTNTYLNSALGVLKSSSTGHPELFWKLITMCGSTGKSQRYSYLALKTAKTGNKEVQLLASIYPTAKLSDLELIASTMTKKQLTALAEEHGIDKVKL